MRANRGNREFHYKSADLPPGTQETRGATDNSHVKPAKSRAAELSKCGLRRHGPVVPRQKYLYIRFSLLLRFNVASYEKRLNGGFITVSRLFAVSEIVVEERA
jgi:hypothetical protein